jgi:hypothetical protein
VKHGGDTTIEIQTKGDINLEKKDRETEGEFQRKKEQIKRENISIAQIGRLFRMFFFACLVRLWLIEKAIKSRAAKK